MAKLLLEKLKESAFLIIPIIVIVLILHFTVAPMPLWSGVALFLASAFLMILGIMLFNLGVDMSLIPIGEYIGSTIVKSRNLLLIVIITFVVGVFVTVAEPDLIILAGQISGVPDSVIIVTVSVGVGLALVGAFLRILFQLPLSYILVGCYLAAFIFSKFTGPDFLSIAWESLRGPFWCLLLWLLGSAWRLFAEIDNGFQVWKLRLKTKRILKIAAGTVYTYFGLILFLASANIGFMPAGYQLGAILIENVSSLTLVLVGLVIGYFVVTHGYGTAKSAIYDILGYGGPKKIISLSIQIKEMTNFILKRLRKEIDFNKTGTGIACTISLSSINNALLQALKQAGENSQMGSDEMTCYSKGNLSSNHIYCKQRLF